MEKQEIRQHIKNLCSQHADKLAEKSADVCQKIISSAVYKEAQVILAYMALKDEVNLDPVILDALKKEKMVAVPKIMDFQKGLMQFFFLDGEQNLNTQTESGTLGISEPDQNLLTPLNPDELCNKKTLILVPGRAFTRNGERLGRGKGFYDKFLAKKSRLPNITAAGVCFDFQIVNTIPTDTNDICMDTVFSDL